MHLARKARRQVALTLVSKGGEDDASSEKTLGIPTEGSDDSDIDDGTTDDTTQSDIEIGFSAELHCESVGDERTMDSKGGNGVIWIQEGGTPICNTKDSLADQGGYGSVSDGEEAVDDQEGFTMGEDKLPLDNLRSTKKEGHHGRSWRLHNVGSMSRTRQEQP